MKLIITENQYQNLINSFINESSNTEDPLTTYLSGNTVLIPLYKEIESVLNDKFTSDHFKNEINYSGGLKLPSPTLDPVAVKKFNDMKKYYGLPSNIKQNSLRDYNNQKNTFIDQAREHGNTINGGLRQAALPGFSQHHTGKAFDISSPSSVTNKMLSSFGFKRPYPIDTGFRMAEPWHILYIK